MKGKKIMKGVLALWLVMSFWACAAYVKPSYIVPGPNPAPNYRFDYTPPKDTKKSAEPFTFLLLQANREVKSPYSTTSIEVDIPRFAARTTEDLDKIISEFSSSITEDLKELMTYKGFRLVQLVKTQDEATYGQREMSNFAIYPKVSIEIDDQLISSEKPKQDITQALVTNQYSPGLVKGVFAMKGRISIELKEPITWQLVWTKSVDIEPSKRDYSFKWNYNPQLKNGYVIGEDTRPQVLASMLQEIYNEVFEKFCTYLDPSEFSMLNKQAQEIRKKALGIIK